MKREEFGVFKKFLKEHGLKLTRQREVILQAFLKAEKHLLVEELYNIVKKKDAAIGQATVFRTLKLFKDAGLAVDIDFGDKKRRFEHYYHHRHHDHMVCISCGALIEVLEPKIEKMQEQLCKRFDFKPEYHRLAIFGFCKNCSERSQ